MAWSLCTPRRGRREARRVRFAPAPCSGSAAAPASSTASRRTTTPSRGHRRRRFGGHDGAFAGLMEQLGNAGGLFAHVALVSRTAALGEWNTPPGDCRGSSEGAGQRANAGRGDASEHLDEDDSEERSQKRDYHERKGSCEHQRIRGSSVPTPASSRAGSVSNSSGAASGLPTPSSESRSWYSSRVCARRKSRRLRESP